MDVHEQLMQAIQSGITEGVKSKVTQSYGNPFDKLIGSVISDSDGKLRKILADAMNSAVDDPDFREEIRASVRHKLASVLVARFGGELEKQVNALKSDPTTRARITVAIEEIVKSKQQA